MKLAVFVDSYADNAIPALECSKMTNRDCWLPLNISRLLSAIRQAELPIENRARLSIGKLMAIHYGSDSASVYRTEMAYFV